LISQLADFNEKRREESLWELKRLADKGLIDILPNRGWVNLHAHTFFSFNAYGFSPSRFLWEAYRLGLEMAGIVDFDVLDGLEETLTAAAILGTKAMVGLETRVFVKEYADKVINSPGEPGIAYIMGTGFYRHPKKGSRAAKILSSLRKRVTSRNLLIIERVNRYLSPVTIDYEKDVLSLTPKGNATERHILIAYDRKSREVFPNCKERISFWAEALGGLPPDTVAEKMKKAHDFQELLRSKLMKGGGVGYIKPQPETFPALEEVVEMVKLLGGIPTATWLDGTNEGEKNPEEFLNFYQKKGLPLLNVIPDRNWNIKDPEEKMVKVSNFQMLMATARKYGVPVIAGTEMNRYGQPLVDNFNAPELKPYLDDFRRAGKLLWEHTQRGIRSGF